MKTKMMNQVTHSIFEVMETMFFLTLEERENNEDIDTGNMKTAAVTFSGSFSGTISLSIPQDLLIVMTENFMGEDMKALSAEHVDGTLKEALNMIAGSALTLLDNTAYMGLGIPEIIPGPDRADETVILTTGSQFLAAHVTLVSGRSRH